MTTCERSRTHDCYGYVWECDECGINVCMAEGSSEDYLCDECWTKFSGPHIRPYVTTSLVTALVILCSIGLAITWNTNRVAWLIGSLCIVIIIGISLAGKGI